jgi:endoglucanase
MTTTLTDEQKKFLETLINTPTPTGSEAAGARLLGRRIRDKTGLTPTIDVHGNLHAVYDAGAETTVMLEGHGDEIGYMVEYIDERGYLYLQALGGIVPPLTAAERLTILTANGPVKGVVGTRPPHLMKADEKKNVAAGDLRLMPCDIGATSKEEAEALVSIGDSAVVDSGYRPLAGTRVSGRGFDDRIGSFAMCEAFIRLVTAAEKPKVNLHYVSSVCEEIGLVGGRLASYAVHPTIGISCDVGFAEGPTGDDIKVCGDIKLGRGGALAVGPIYHKALAAHFRSTAAAREIPLQIHPTPKGAGNNGWAMKMERGGAAVVQIAIPLRYMHSPVEVLDLTDVESVIDVVAASVAGLSDDFPLLPEQP